MPGTPFLGPPEMGDSDMGDTCKAAIGSESFCTLLGYAALTLVVAGISCFFSSRPLVGAGTIGLGLFAGYAGCKLSKARRMV